MAVAFLRCSGILGVKIQLPKIKILSMSILLRDPSLFKGPMLNYGTVTDTDTKRNDSTNAYGTLNEYSTLNAYGTPRLALSYVSVT